MSTITYYLDVNTINKFANYTPENGYETKTESIFDSDTVNSLDLHDHNADGRIALQLIPYSYNGDYGSGLLGRANYQAIKEEYKSLFGIALWYVPYHFGTSILVRSDILALGFDPETFIPEKEMSEDDLDDIQSSVHWLIETISDLEKYPVVDDDLLNQIEMDDFDDQWVSYLRNDYLTALGKKYNDSDLDLSRDTLDFLRDKAMEKSGDYPECDGDHMYIDVDKLAKHTLLGNLD